LAEAYRFALVRLGSRIQIIGSKPWCNITNTAGRDSYTTIAGRMQFPGPQNRRGLFGIVQQPDVQIF
jgi:hypothetical protein